MGGERRAYRCGAVVWLPDVCFRSFYVRCVDADGVGEGRESGRVCQREADRWQRSSGGVDASVVSGVVGRSVRVSMRWIFLRAEQREDNGTTGCRRRRRLREMAGGAQGRKGKWVCDEGAVSDGCGRFSSGGDSSPLIVAGREGREAGGGTSL